MKRLFFLCSLPALLCACANNNETKVKGASTDSTGTTTSMAMPYTAAYTDKWTADVSDGDLKTVLDSYKEWENGNIQALANTMGDSVVVDMADGTHLMTTRDELMKRWGGYRDSLSSVSIKMDTWSKLYSPDKKEGFVVVWYDETDTYKNGKVDSASYHDINQLKDGKIVWYAQYKRPKK